MGSLFLVELASFLAKTTQSTIVVDFNRDQQVRDQQRGIKLGTRILMDQIIITQSPSIGGRSGNEMDKKAHILSRYLVDPPISRQIILPDPHQLQHHDVGRALRIRHRRRAGHPRCVKGKF